VRLGAFALALVVVFVLALGAGGLFAVVVPR
jgi:hypothetical protein